MPRVWSSVFTITLAVLAMAHRSPAQDEPGPLQEAIESLLGESLSRVKVHGHAQAGFTLNAHEPADRLNFGRLFDDRANDFRLNGVGLTVEQPFRSDPSAFDWGFKLQTSIGTDARFTHGMGLLEDVTDGSIQPDVVESWVAIHLPWLTEGGVDLKLGTFATLCGLESMDPESNLLYSHGYIFNFGVPLKHTGLLLTTHATSWLDIHTGAVSGINTAVDDNNDAWSFHGGVTARLLDDRLTLALGAHVGPENDSIYHRVPGVHPSSDVRTILDLVITAKPADWLTAYLDLNHGQDDAPLGLDGTKPEWYGAAATLAFHVSDSVDLVVRGEVFRDDDGFAVAQFAADDDYLDLQEGRLGGLDRRTVGGGAATYRAVTLGARIAAAAHFIIQCEVRADFADGSRPFRDSTDDSQFTVGASFLWTF